MTILRGEEMMANVMNQDLDRLAAKGLFLEDNW